MAAGGQGTLKNTDSLNQSCSGNCPRENIIMFYASCFCVTTVLKYSRSSLIGKNGRMEECTSECLNMRLICCL